MPLILTQDSEPSTPASTEVSIYLGADGKLYAKKPDGSRAEVAGGRVDRNALTNGTFLFAQRQTPGTLTTYSNTSGRTYGADRWGFTNENASVQYRRVDTTAAAETGLGSRFYAEIKKITNAGKVVFSQVLEASDAIAYRGRRVRVQFKAKNSVGSHTLRCALLYLTSSGTVDSIPATFVSAFGAASTDPTWGTNLVAITPAVGSTNSTVVGAGLSSTLNSSWRQYGGVFAVPATAQNLIVVIFTDAQMAANDIFHLAEVGMFDGEEERPVICTDIHDELDRCQRFCWKTFDVDVAPVQNVGSATGALRFPAPIAASGNQRSPSFNYPVRMRATPTVTTYNPQAANAQVRDTNASGDCSGTTVQAANERSLAVLAVGNAGGAVGNALSFHVLCEAEL